MAPSTPRTAARCPASSSPFDQRELTSPESPASYSMAETGYVYVPASCAAQQPCRVHIALHGCKQNFDTIQDRYIQHAGYNEWADTNRLIILYPQTIVGDPADFEPQNPFGCWDWWGYTNFNYAVKAGRQITAIKAMLDRLTSGHVQNRERQRMPPLRLGLWSTMFRIPALRLLGARSPGPKAIRSIARSAATTSFTPIGSVLGPSFADLGLRPCNILSLQGDRYAQRWCRGASSPVVTATTLPVPPRAIRPGAARSPDGRICCPSSRRPVDRAAAPRLSLRRRALTRRSPWHNRGLPTLAATVKRKA